MGLVSKCVITAVIRCSKVSSSEEIASLSASVDSLTNRSTSSTNSSATESGSFPVLIRSSNASKTSESYKTWLNVTTLNDSNFSAPEGRTSEVWDNGNPAQTFSSSESCLSMEQHFDRTIIGGHPDAALENPENFTPKLVVKTANVEQIF